MLNRTVVEYLGLIPTEGDVGVEIEVEMSDEAYFPKSVTKDWRIDSDGSLKGYGYEFVLRKPNSPLGVAKSVKTLKDGVKASNQTINKTIRAGVHIHLNMQEKTIGDVFRLMSCYYPLETVLTRFCGDGREGNLFCLRAGDAEYMLHLATQALKGNDVYLLRTNQLRYSAFNLQSMFSYGSVEFRALATKPELDNIIPWIKILLALRAYSEKVPTAWEAINCISGTGPREWMYSVFGKKLGDMLHYPEIEGDIMRDARRAQMLCYQMAKMGV